jgi:hypothetical protein
MDKSKKWKIAAVVVALIPTVFFLMFAIGEGTGGLMHYLQALPIVILVLFGWYVPRIAGWMFVVLGGIATIMYAFSSGENLSVAVLVESLVFIPFVVSGIFFLLGAKKYTTTNVTL